MTKEWQYLVEQFGTALRADRPDEVETFLNEAAVEGWELAQTASVSNGNKLLVIIRRKLERRTRRRLPKWP